jgi:hypothetical protein
MATMVHTLGTLTNFDHASNINSLANNACKPLGGDAGLSYVDNSSLKYPSVNLFFTFNLAASGLAVGGSIEIYLLKCLDTPATVANWSDGIDPAGVADIAGSIFNLAPIITLRADSAMNNLDVIYVFNDIAYSQFKDIDGTLRSIGEMPKYWTLAVWNKSGAAIQGAGNAAKFQLKTYGSS